MKHPKFDTTPDVSKRMGKVHLKGGNAERTLAKALWHAGYRYRLNYKKLPGSPDIAITKYKIAIFVDGEFWHGYDWGNRKFKLKRNREYWIAKIEENISRDLKNDQLLKEQGWTPIHFWEKNVLNSLNRCVEIIFKEIEKKSKSDRNEYLCN